VRFDLLASDGRARRGRLHLRRARSRPGVHAGRNLRHGQGHDAGGTHRARAEIVLGNTFHLMLRPGTG